MKRKLCVITVNICEESETKITNEISFFKIYCGLAEAVSRLAHNQEVGGSNPSPATQGRTGGFYSKFDGKSEATKTKPTNFFLIY
jgi:hypothetical protein